MKRIAIPALTLFSLVDVIPAQVIPTRSEQMLLPGLVSGSRRVLARSRDGYDLGFSAVNAPARNGPDGSLTFRQDPATLSRVFPSQATRSFAASSDIVDFRIDARSHVHVVLSGRLYVELDANLGVVRSGSLPGTPRRAEVDAGGRVWIAIENAPADLLSWVTPANPNPSTVSLPIDFGGVSDIESIRGPNGDRVLVGSNRSSTILEVDSSGAVTRSLDVPGVGSIHKISVGPDHRVYVAKPSGLWRLNDTDGSFDRILSGPINRIDFDTAGGAWISSLPTGYIGLDLDSGRQTSSIPGILAGLDLLQDDPSGVHLGLVVDPLGDWDSDGDSNSSEIALGSNPWNPQSDSTLRFDTDAAFLDAERRIEIIAEGRPGIGFVLVSTALESPGTGVAIPGVDGQLLLRAPMPSVFQFRFPSRVSLTLPPMRPDTTIYLQPVFVPSGGGTPRFGEVAAFLANEPALVTSREAFTSSSRLDTSRSSGEWAQGRATPGRLGSIGRLGDFDPTLGMEVEPGIFEFSTDGMSFPASATLFARVENVTNGAFDFMNFVVPSGVTVRFVGSRAAILRVNGEARIDGTLSVNGQTVTADGFVDTVAQTGMFATGQPGGEGGAGGGSGGTGADGCLGTGAAPNNHGQPGSNLLAPALSAYRSSAADTGGRGGALFPASGLFSSMTFGLFNAVNIQMGSGGGGGGFQLQGSAASFQSDNPRPEFGPLADSGVGTGSLALPLGVSSAEHFLVGGSGGGGGASHGFGFLTSDAVAGRSWRAGFGGAGGGGALAIRAGAGIHVSAAGRISSDGGHAAIDALGQTVGAARRAAAPGGGGSGGSILLQSAAVFEQFGTLSVQGGAGGVQAKFFITSSFRADGGDGAHGLVRLEKPQTPTLADLGTVLGPTQLPAESVGPLLEVDAIALQQSDWYATSAASPEWLHYELDVDADGVLTTYTDRLDNFRPAVGFGLPVQLYLQSGDIGLDGATVEPTTPWESFTSRINRAPGRYLRFLLVFDRSTHQNVSVTRAEFISRTKR